MRSGKSYFLRPVLFSLGIVGTLILFESCKGGGRLFFSKPVCHTPSLFANVTYYKGYTPYASKRYKCVNGNFEPDGDEYRCVPPVCPDLETILFEGDLKPRHDGCGWLGDEIVKYKKGKFFKAKGFMPRAEYLDALFMSTYTLI